MIVTDAPGTFHLEPSADAEAAEAARGLAELHAARRTLETSAIEQQAKSVRDSAKNWLAGVTGLYGLLGVAGVAVGKDSITGLASGWKVAAAAVVLVGVVTAAAALFLGYRAAYGLPRSAENLVTVSDDDDLVTWYRAYQDSYGGRDLRRAVGAAAASLLLLVVATGVIWFGPAADPAAPTVIVTTADDTTSCGRLLASKVDGTIRVKRTDGTVDAVAAPDIVSLKPGTCRPSS